tara:strand:+ start:51 stop:437 length:387 start_codon:yes stop_codon:yes gene_type:complete
LEFILLNFYSRIFLFAGIYNIGAAITFIFGYKWLFPLIGMAIPSSLSFMYLAFAFVFVFGLGYIIVSNDLNKSHDIVKLGALSKILAFLVIFHGCIVKILPPILYIAAFIDLIWGAVFIYYIKNIRMS